MSVPMPKTAPAPAKSEVQVAKVSESKDDTTKTAAAAVAEEEHPFFHYYGQLAHQQNMLQDSVRTGTYRKAVMDNAIDFQGKVVVDVGTGSGILAMFAARAGARKVYAVEASDMAHCARKLIAHNGLSDIITVLHGKVEEISIDEKVDVIISEPMGFLLVHERMLESFVAARKLFMKPEGRMFPAVGTMIFLPFSDWNLFNEQNAKAGFWASQSFYGFDVSCLEKEAHLQHFAQPVVGYIDPSILVSDVSKPATHEIDFEHVDESEMTTITVPFSFEITSTTLMHGLACWFDVDFVGSSARVKLSTGPHSPGTHWYQCRLLLHQPLAVNASQVVTGTVKMKANKKFSYDIDLECRIQGTDIVSRNHIKLHDQLYHYLQQPMDPVVAGNDENGGGQTGW